MSSLVKVRKLNKCAETSFGAYYLEAKMKQNLTKYFFSLCSKYIEGNFKCSNHALGSDVVVI